MMDISGWAAAAVLLALAVYAVFEAAMLVRTGRRLRQLERDSMLPGQMPQCHSRDHPS